MIQMQDVMSKAMPDFREGSIVKGRILEIRPREVLVDVGYKSEGVIPLTEFEEAESLEVGDEVDVLLERLENEEGMVVLSKEKAAYRQNWNKIVSVFEGDGLIKGKVKSVVKGGLMVNIGVEAFLPASQIDVVPPKDLQQFVGNAYDFKIVKLNDDRKNVVLSRREVIEQERSEKRQKFMEGVNVGDRVTGTVKNITDFGAFIDLDGMDGLLHVTDMTWGRLGLFLMARLLRSRKVWKASFTCPNFHGRNASCARPIFSASGRKSKRSCWALIKKNRKFHWACAS